MASGWTLMSELVRRKCNLNHIAVTQSLAIRDYGLQAAAPRLRTEKERVLTISIQVRMHGRKKRRAVWCE